MFLFSRSILSRSYHTAASAQQSVVNGVRVVTVEGHNLPATVSILVRGGARAESNENRGVSHILKRLSYRSNKVKGEKNSALATVRRMERFGSFTFSTSREYQQYSACFYSNFPDVFGLLSQAIHPTVEDWEVEVVKNQVKQDTADYLSSAENVLSDAIHVAAFRNSGLENNPTAPVNNLSALSPNVIADFQAARLNPENVAVVGVGISHNLLASEVGQLVLNSSEPLQLKKASYYGGNNYIPVGGADYTYYAIAFNGASGVKEAATYAVLQALLGSSDNAATRLGKANAQNNFSAVAFNTVYSDAGIFGVYGASSNAKALADGITNTLRSLKGEISESEFNIARKLATFNFLNEVEGSRSGAINFLAQSVFSQGGLVTPDAFVSAVQNVDLKGLNGLIDKVLASKPTVVGLGNIAELP